MIYLHMHDRSKDAWLVVLGCIVVYKVGDLMYFLKKTEIDQAVKSKEINLLAQKFQR